MPTLLSENIRRVAVILVNFESDNYATRISNSVEEDRELIEAGFEYITERDSFKIYRKPK